MPLTWTGRVGPRIEVPPLRRPDVWLVSAHHGRWPSRAPVVGVLWEVGWHTEYLRSLLSPWFVELIEEGTRRGVQDCAWLIVPAESSKAQAIEAYGYDPDRIAVVPLGVDLTTFHPDRQGGAELVARAQLGSDAPYVLFAGNLGPRKNLTALREAMVELAERGLPHRLVVVAGPAHDRRGEEPPELIGELPGWPGRFVRIKRPTDVELATLMAGADAFCLPSLTEGFGLPVLEAMACGTPVVTSNRGSLPEVVGDAGLVVEPTGPALAEALYTLLSDATRRAQLGEVSRRRAETMSWDRTAEGWLAVLRKAAA
ncbi:MAG: glycosyltransferase family 4 protein [Acidimicrobiales bacterium]